MWVVSGLVLSIVLALVAWTRSKAGSGTYYESQVYGMGPAAHRGYGLAFAALAAVLMLALMWPAMALPALAVFAVVAILYGATFLRGASGEDE
jgi:hypothetical protein